MSTNHDVNGKRHGRGWGWGWGWRRGWGRAGAALAVLAIAGASLAQRGDAQARPTTVPLDGVGRSLSTAGPSTLFAFIPGTGWRNVVIGNGLALSTTAGVWRLDAGSPPPPAVLSLTRKTFDPVAGTTAFTIDPNYWPQSLQVFWNGLLLREGDYTVGGSGGSIVTLGRPTIEGDVLAIYYFRLP